MARGVNKVILIGNLGKDPEVKFFPNGDAFCNCTVATSESWNDKQSGEKKERTEWHNVVFTKKLAEIVGQYLKKGSKVYIEGSLRTRKWEKDGQDRYTTEIVVQDMQMLDGKGGGSDSSGGDGGGYSRSSSYSEKSSSSSARPQSAPARSAPQPAPMDDSGFSDDDIPF